MWAAPSQATRELGVEKCEGGPRKWEAQAVRRETRQQQMTLPIFSRSFSLHLPLTPIAPRLPPPPPPSHQNASQRWLLSSFQHDSHCHHLPHVQRRARGGLFHSFNLTSTTTTSLVSKHELEVVFFGILTCLPPPPPPSHPHASRRWSISLFQCASHHNHLPCVQM